MRIVVSRVRELLLHVKPGSTFRTVTPTDGLIIMRDPNESPLIRQIIWDAPCREFSRLESGKNLQLQTSPFRMAEPGLVYSGGVESFATQATLAIPGFGSGSALLSAGRASYLDVCLLNRSHLGADSRTRLWAAG
jgi:hypothetical protein